jgi:hypothetical protein
VCGHQQLLRGDAPPQRAGTTEAFVLLYNRGLKTKLAGPDGSHITAWTTAYYGYVKLFVCQLVWLLSTKRSADSEPIWGNEKTTRHLVVVCRAFLKEWAL